MVKKYTAVFFLTLASIIMLAFVVVPHHHHQKYICFNSTHCENELPAGQDKHNENPFDNEHGCVRNLFQTQISRIQSSVHSCDKGHCFHFVHISFLFTDLFSLSLEAENKVSPNLLYREKLHSSHYISDLAGRAPPFRS